MLLSNNGGDVSLVQTQGGAFQWPIIPIPQSVYLQLFSKLVSTRAFHEKKSKMQKFMTSSPTMRAALKVHLLDSERS